MEWLFYIMIWVQALLLPVLVFVHMWKADAAFWKQRNKDNDEIEGIF